MSLCVPLCLIEFLHTHKKKKKKKKKKNKRKKEKKERVKYCLMGIINV